MPSNNSYTCEISLQQQLEQMIRKVHQDQKIELQISKKIQIYSYRNAIYQGELSPINAKRAGRGIIYLTDTHHFIACNQFAQNKLNGSSLFFHEHAKYMYGEWRNNKPHGVLVARIDEILIIAEFTAGKLIQSRRFVAIFEKFNTGLILQLRKSGKLQLHRKLEVLTPEDILILMNECQFRVEKGQKAVISHSLIKFLNKRMSSDKKVHSKLRFINNSYYRFGYDVGLAVLFDDQFRVLSVGVHNKNALNSYGVKYYGSNLGNRVQEGVFDGYNTYTYEQKSKPIHKISELYRKFHLSEINFQNQLYKDPSDYYFRYLQDLVNQQVVTSLFQKEEILGSSRKIISSLNQSKDVQQEYSTKKQKLFQKLNSNSISFQNLRKSPIQLQGDKISRGIPTLYKYQLPQHQKKVDSFQFESLNEKKRLQMLKKQLYQNVSHKVKLPQEEQDKQNANKRQRIITKSPVKIKTTTQKKIAETSPIQFRYRIQENQENKNKNIFIQDSSVQKQKGQPIPNLQKKINITIKSDPSMQQSSSQRRSKKKIFEEYSNIKHDYSPQTQVSPFKSKIKSRIFQHTPSKQAKSRSKSPNRIFGKSKTPQKRQTGKFYLNPNEISLKQQQKSESSSEIKMYPVTMQKVPRMNKAFSRQLLFDSKDQKRQTPKNKQKTNIQDYLKHEKNTNEEQLIRKSNNVYKNNMKSDYSNYVYEPIQVKQKGNAPYVQNKTNLSKTVSNASLKQNPSQHTIQRQASKKSIQDPSPSKKQKMGAYMVGQAFQLKEAQRLSDFKRRVNYF